MQVNLGRGTCADLIEPDLTSGQRGMWSIRERFRAMCDKQARSTSVHHQQCGSSRGLRLRFGSLRSAGFAQDDRGELEVDTKAKRR